MTTYKAVFLFAALYSSAALATEWPPAIDTEAKHPEFHGRKTEFYRHLSKPEWGYKKPQEWEVRGHTLVIDFKQR